MDWEYLNSQLRKVYHKKTISVDDKQTLQKLQKIIIHRYPYIRREGILKAIEISIESMYEPYWCEEFLQRLTEKMYEVPYKVLVGKLMPKISYSRIEDQRTNTC